MCTAANLWAVCTGKWLAWGAGEAVRFDGIPQTRFLGDHLALGKHFTAVGCCEPQDLAGSHCSLFVDELAKSTSLVTGASGDSLGTQHVGACLGLAA